MSMEFTAERARELTIEGKKAVYDEVTNWVMVCIREATLKGKSEISLEISPTCNESIHEIINQDLMEEVVNYLIELGYEGSYEVHSYVQETAGHYSVEKRKPIRYSVLRVSWYADSLE